MLLGHLRKDTAETSRFSVNLSDWLDEGEAIVGLEQLSVIVEDADLATAWQADYPFTPTEELVDIPDTAPLELVAYGLTHGNAQAEILVGGGTPGLTYLVSMLAVGSTSSRKKQVDFNVTVNVLENTDMVYIP